MYVMRTVPGREIQPENRWERPFYIPAHTTLCEMTPRQFAWCCALPPDRWKGVQFRRCSPERARAYVASHGHHETPLYMGEDRQGRSRIMYARE